MREVFFYLAPGNVQQGTDNVPSHIWYAPETFQPRASYDVEKHCLGVVIFVVSGGCLASAGKFVKCAVTQDTCGFLGGSSAFPGKAGHIYSADFKGDIETFAQLLAEMLVTVTFLASQAVVYVNCPQRKAHFMGKPMQDCYKANAVRTARKPCGDSVALLYHTAACYCLTHLVRNVHADLLFCGSRPPVLAEEQGILTVPSEVYSACFAVTVLGNDTFREVNVLHLVLVVVAVTVEEHYNIRILLDRA